MRRTPYWLGLVLALLFGCGVEPRAEATPARPRATPRVAPQPSSPPAAPAPVLAPPPAPPSESEPLRYLAIGGGSLPESNEVSLEQNLELAEQTLAGPGTLAFAAGAGSQGVRLLDRDPLRGDALLARLGEIFAPRPGRQSRYRPTRLQSAQPADRATVERLIGDALRRGEEPLLLYATTHGDQGERPRDNTIALWGGEPLTAEQLARLHDGHARPLVAVVASCFSGGFGELAFHAGDDAQGAARAPRCGLFAGTWDRETSGCDPDPERARQEGYSLHLLNALRGRDRNGRALALSGLDADHDGRVSLLEAHAWAAMTGQSFDVPTTTSERYLRAVQTRRGPAARELLPEHAALVERLAASLGLSTEAASAARLAELEQRLEALDAALETADADSETAYRALAARLLARWPVLDDPYHPEFGTVLERDRAGIQAALDSWPEAARLAQAEDAVERAELAREPTEVAAAITLRLVRGHETLALAGGLQRRGGPPFAHLQALLACERFVPALRSPDDGARPSR